jgi:two-component system, NarL family, nitrate/nitrite response regulator NarL
MSTVPSDPNDITVLVLDHVRVNRENLMAMLVQEPSIADAVGAAEGEDAVGSLQGKHFTVVLISISGERNRAICRELVDAAKPAPVIAYAITGSYSEVLACAEAGVAGYLLCDEPQTEFVKAVAAAARGDVWCPSRVAAMLMRRMGPNGGQPGTPDGLGRLTVREREIVELIDKGMSNKDIARKLSIEVRTVKNHVHNLLEKLEVHRRGDAAALMRRRSDVTVT